MLHLCHACMSVCACVRMRGVYVCLCVVSVCVHVCGVCVCVYACICMSITCPQHIFSNSVESEVAQDASSQVGKQYNWFD